jgi:hypothetical protein
VLRPIGLEKRTSAAKAVISEFGDGTAEAVPFVGICVGIGQLKNLIGTSLNVATLQRTTTMSKRGFFGVPEFVEGKGGGVDGFLLF